MSDTTHLDRCAICNGTREEHSAGMMHMFTTNPGELRLPPQVETQTRKKLDAALVVVSKLIEVLIDNDLITREEALSCFGVEAKPVEPSEVVNVDEPSHAGAN